VAVALDSTAAVDVVCGQPFGDMQRWHLVVQSKAMNNAS
jgi:hypothetical protein